MKPQRGYIYTHIYTYVYSFGLDPMVYLGFNFLGIFTKALCSPKPVDELPNPSPTIHPLPLEDALHRM